MTTGKVSPRNISYISSRDSTGWTRDVPGLSEGQGWDLQSSRTPYSCMAEESRHETGKAVVWNLHSPSPGPKN